MDLKDAYLHVPIIPPICGIFYYTLGICVRQGSALFNNERKVLPFFATAPMVFFQPLASSFGSQAFAGKSHVFVHC